MCAFTAQRKARAVSPSISYMGVDSNHGESSKIVDRAEIIVNYAKMSRPVLAPRPSPRPGATVAAGFVSGMLAGAPEQAALLREVGMPAAVLHDPRARVALTQYAALYNRLVAALDDEAFGLFSAPLRAGVFEFLCRSLV